MSRLGQYDRVRMLIVQTLGVEEARIRPESRLDEDLSLDSLDRVDLSMSLEDEFGIVVEEEEWEKVESVGDILSLLDRSPAVR